MSKKIHIVFCLNSTGNFRPLWNKAFRSSDDAIAFVKKYFPEESKDFDHNFAIRTFTFRKASSIVSEFNRTGSCQWSGALRFRIHLSEKFLKNLKEVVEDISGANKKDPSTELNNANNERAFIKLDDVDGFRVYIGDSKHNCEEYMTSEPNFKTKTISEAVRKCKDIGISKKNISISYKSNRRKMKAEEFRKRNGGLSPSDVNDFRVTSAKISTAVNSFISIIDSRDIDKAIPDLQELKDVLSNLRNKRDDIVSNLEELESAIDFRVSSIYKNENRG